MEEPKTNPCAGCGWQPRIERTWKHSSPGMKIVEGSMWLIGCGHAQSTIVMPTLAAAVERWNMENPTEG